MAVEITDAAWKKIEAKLPGVKGTGIGALLRAYEDANKKLVAMKVGDGSKTTGADAVKAQKLASAAWKALRDAEGLFSKLVKGKKAPAVNSPDGKDFYALTGAMNNQKIQLMMLSDRLKANAKAK